MAKRKIVDDGGAFRRRITYFPKPRNAREALQQVVIVHNRWADIEGTAERLEQWVGAILERKPPFEADTIKDAQTLLDNIAHLRVALKAEKAASAAAAAYSMGVLDERLRIRVYYNEHVRTGRENLKIRRHYNEQRQQDSRKLYEEINKQVANRIKKRGERKQLSDYAILKRACENNGLKDVSSYYRMRRKLEKKK